VIKNNFKVKGMIPSEVPILTWLKLIYIGYVGSGRESIKKVYGILL
jgi:hypothetical protein